MGFSFGNKMTKAGIEFEIFTKSLYQELLNQQDLKNLKIEHDIKLKGNTTQEHQIDIYWEFEIAGITHKVAVECKDYKNVVSVGKIRDFYGVINDIEGIKGIFVTNKGYQSGAITYAQGKNIDLKVIKNKNITQSDFKDSGIITTLNLSMTMFIIENVKYNFIFDMQYLYQHNHKDNLTGSFSVDGNTNEIFILDKNKKPLFSLQDFSHEIPREPTNSPNLTFEKDLSHDFYFIDYPNRTLNLKINKIEVIYDTVSSCETSILEAKATAKAIIKDIINNSCEVVGLKRLDF